MAFQVSKSSHNSRTKHYYANPRLQLEAYRNPYLHFVDPSAAVAVYTHTNTLPYTSLAHALRGIIIQNFNWQNLMIWLLTLTFEAI